MSCHVRVWEWIHTHQLPECQGTHCLKQVWNLKFKWLQLESNPRPLISQTNTQPFSQTDQRIELYCEYLSSCNVTHAFESVSTLYSCLNVKKLLTQSRREIWSLSDWNWTRSQNHLIHKRTLNYLAKLSKWLSCVVSTYLYVLVTSRMRFKVNPQFIVAWMSRNSLLEAGGKFEVKLTAAGT